MEGSTIGNLGAILPRTAGDLTRWATLLGNCLDDFGPSAVPGRSTIIGIERDGNLHYALEVNPSTVIRQFVGPANRPPTPADRDVIVRLLLEHQVIEPSEPDNRIWLPAVEADRRSHRALSHLACTHPSSPEARGRRCWGETCGMKHRRPDRPVRQSSSAVAGFQFPPEVILLAVRWYLRYGLSYRDLEQLMAERGIEVDHVTVYRWVQRFTPLIIDAARPVAHRSGTGGSSARPTSRCRGPGGTCTTPWTSMGRSST